MFQERPVGINRYFGEFLRLPPGTLGQVNQTVIFIRITNCLMNVIIILFSFK